MQQNECEHCHGELDPATGRGYARPSVVLAGAVVRRAQPKAWPEGGLAANYRDYGTVYEILMVRKKTGKEEEMENEGDGE